MKERLATAPVLGYPDTSLPYILDTDAIDVSVGAVPSQVQGGKERVVAYYSKTLAPSGKTYCITRRELLAIVKTVKCFRPYVDGQQLWLWIDHALLRWLCLRKEPSNQIARWLENSPSSSILWSIMQAFNMQC